MSPLMTYILPLSSMKLTGWQKETGFGLEKTILQDRAHGSICPSSPLHGLITPVIDIKINDWQKQIKNVYFLLKIHSSLTYDTDYNMLCNNYIYYVLYFSYF